MRQPKYLSPTSLACYEENPTTFYLNYLATDRPDKIPQTRPMSVGSAFDAYAKSYLHHALFGKVNPKFAFEALFEAQVEPHNRDWAIEAGGWAMKFYRQSGALADLMSELQTAVGEPTFEFDVLGAVQGYREGVNLNIEVPLFGKPDLRFINSQGAHIIYDFKVNGFCSKSNTSPVPGYLKCTDGWDGSLAKASRGNGDSHPDCYTIHKNGMKIATHYLERYETKWADQLATYGWLLGEPVGFEFIVGIDQLCCKPSGVADRPLIRVAQHRARVNEQYQFELLGRYQKLWSLIVEEPFHFFRDMTLAESQQACEQLNHSGLAITPDMSEEEKAKIRLLRE